MSDSATPWTIQSLEFFRPEYWSGWPFCSPGDLLNLGVKPGSPALQVDSLPAEPWGKPRILEWAAYPFSSRSSQPRGRTWVSCIAGGFFTGWATISGGYQQQNRKSILIKITLQEEEDLARKFDSWFQKLEIQSFGTNCTECKPLLFPASGMGHYK